MTEVTHEDKGNGIRLVTQSYECGWCNHEGKFQVQIKESDSSTFFEFNCKKCGKKNSRGTSYHTEEEYRKWHEQIRIEIKLDPNFALNLCKRLAELNEKHKDRPCKEPEIKWIEPLD